MKPTNKVFLKLDRALQEEIITEGGIKLFLQPEYNVEWNAVVTGIVAGIPINCNKDIKLGDEVAFSYKVISDRTFGKGGDYYMPIGAVSPVKQKYTNSAGNQLIIQQFPAMYGKFNNFWAGCLLDKRGEVLDGTQGTESEVERWKSQFSFSNNHDLKFMNLFEFNGQDYWRADMDLIFAKRVKGIPVSVSDRVIMSVVETNVKHKIELIHGKPIPYNDVKMRYIDRGCVVSGGENIGLKKGDIAGFNPDFCEKYNLWGKNYFLVKERRINGIYDEN